MDQNESRRLDALERRLANLTNQVELERVKNFALMAAIVQYSDLKIVAAKSKFAPIAPIERLDGQNGATIMAFSGLTLELSMPVAEFYRMSAEHGQTVYFIKDHLQAWYQRGLLGLSHDVPSTVEALARITAGDSPDLRTFGTSAGGFAAILFGVLLKARKVVAFSPQTIIDPSTVEAFKSQDTRAADALSGAGYLDLLPIVAQNRDTEIHIYYGSGHIGDMKSATRLQGLPNVTLHPHPHDSHNIGGWMKQHGLLENALAPIFTKTTNSQAA